MVDVLLKGLLHRFEVRVGLIIIAMNVEDELRGVIADQPGDRDLRNPGTLAAAWGTNNDRAFSGFIRLGCPDDPLMVRVGHEVPRQRSIHCQG